MLVQDLAQPLAYDIAFETFFVGKKCSFGHVRPFAQDIKDYHDKYGSDSPLIPFVTYLPIEALAICFTTVSSLNKAQFFLTHFSAQIHPGSAEEWLL
jgi:hypothetical protein